MVPERRRSSRIRCHLPVRLYPQGETRVVETLTKDLSLVGLKCLSPSSKPIATPMAVELDLGQTEHALSLKARVVWFQELPQSDQFYLGLVFHDLSDITRQRLSRYLDKISPNLPSSTL